MANRDADALKGTGEIDEAINVYIERGDWGSALETANENSPQMLMKYLMRHAKVTMESGRFGDAIAAFAKYGLPLNPKFYSAYQTLALEVFAGSDPKEVRDLRKALATFVANLEDQGETNSPEGREFKRFLTAAHLFNLKPILEKAGLNKLVAQLSIGLLRYSDLIRVDKLYYDAGMNSKKQVRIDSLSFNINVS